VHPQYTKCTPRQSKRQFLGHFLLGGGIFGGLFSSFIVVLDGLLRATTRKRSSTFLRKKVHPLNKILAMPMVRLLQNIVS